MHVKRRPSLNEKGFGIVDFLIAMVVTTVSCLLILQIAGQAKEEQARTSLPLQLDLIRQNLMTLIQSSSPWTDTITRNPGMACLLNTTACVDPSNATRSISNQAFALWDGSSATAYYDGTSSSNGFTLGGTPCTTYSSQGNDACPFHYDLTWTAICPDPATPATCINPTVLISATLKFSPKNKKNIALNVTNYSFGTLYRSAK